MSSARSDAMDRNDRPASRSCGRAILLLCVVAAVFFGYWRFAYYPTTPQYGLKVFLSAAIEHDYAKAYSRLHLPAHLKIIVPSASALAGLAERTGGIVPKLRDYRLGKVSVSDDSATVEAVLITEEAENGAGRASTDVTVGMSKRDGLWKVDAGWALGELIRRGGDDLLKTLLL